MNTDRLRKAAYLTIVGVGVPVICFCLLEYVVPVLVPFALAWGIALAVRRPSEKISKLTGISPRVCRPIVTALVVVSLFLLVGLIVFRVSREVWEIIVGFGEGDEVRNFIDDFLASGGILENFINNYGEGLSDALFGIVSSVLSGLFGMLTSLAGFLPKAILAIAITVISAIYFSIDLDRINKAVISLVPEGKREAVIRMKDGFFSAGIKYIRSYFLLFLITLGTVLVGFLILRIPYALFLALILACLDLLPVIGVGTFLIPYGIFEIVSGDTFRGIGLLVLFALQTVVRELAEPKILGKNLGVHPLLTLVVLYTGYSLFGFVGILAVPVFLAAINVLLTKKNTADVDGSKSGK